MRRLNCCCRYSLPAALGIATCAVVLGACRLPPPVVVVAEPPEAEIVPAPPPPPRQEAYGLAPSDDHLWQDGYWDWDPEAMRYSWVDGCWVLPEPGYELVGAMYFVDAGRWRYRRPYWRSRRDRRGRKHRRGPKHHRVGRPAEHLSQAIPPVQTPAPPPGEGHAAAGDGQQSSKQQRTERMAPLPRPSDGYRTDRTGAIVLSSGPATFRRRQEMGSAASDYDAAAGRAKHTTKRQPAAATHSSGGLSVAPRATTERVNRRALEAAGRGRVITRRDIQRQQQRRSLLLRNPSWRPTPTPRPASSAASSSSYRSSTPGRVQRSVSPSRSVRAAPRPRASSVRVTSRVQQRPRVSQHHSVSMSRSRPSRSTNSGVSASRSSRKAVSASPTRRSSSRRTVSRSSRSRRR